MKRTGGLVIKLRTFSLNFICSGRRLTGSVLIVDLSKPLPHLSWILALRYNFIPDIDHFGLISMSMSKPHVYVHVHEIIHVRVQALVLYPCRCP
jgi:hypothetical protein